MRKVYGSRFVCLSVVCEVSGKGELGLTRIQIRTRTRTRTRTPTHPARYMERVVTVWLWVMAEAVNHQEGAWIPS